MLTRPENQDKQLERLAGETSIYLDVRTYHENEQTMMISRLNYRTNTKKTGKSLFFEKQLNKINQLKQLLV